MTKATSFPIVTTDRKANESVEGLCPTLCADVGVTGSITGVVSEYGIRNALNRYTDNAVSGINLGVGQEIFKEYDYDEENEQGTVSLRSIKSLNDNRITITENGGQINIDYDGRSSSTLLSTNNQYVQGGSDQLWGNFGGISGFSYFNLTTSYVNSGSSYYSEISSYIGSGYSINSIPICANMQNTSLSAGGYLSGSSLNEWNKDISLGKVSVRISNESAFPNSGEVIWLGISGDHDYLGYFKTVTENNIILNNTEWVEFIYNTEFYENQYRYFTAPDNIYAYTTGVTIDNYNYLSGITTGGVNNRIFGKFDVVLFYDQINYNKIDDETITLSSSGNSQTNPVTSQINADGWIETRWYDGSYTDQFSNELYNYTVSGANLEYYGDKNERISFPVSSGDTIFMYIPSNIPSENVGSLEIKLTKEEY